MSSSPQEPTTVLIVDDQDMVRMGLRMMIDAESDMVVVGEAVDGNDAVLQAAALRPDVVLMDIRMPRLNGIDATRTIIAAGTAAAVVLITTFDDEEYLLDGLRAGAYGFLLKDAGAPLLTLAVRSALEGDTIIAPSMTRSLLESRLSGSSSRPHHDRADDGLSAAATTLARLSPRELEVLSHVARGASNAEIAHRIWVSETTVKSHLSSILAKISATNRVQAAVFAYESGYLLPGEGSGR